MAHPKHTNDQSRAEQKRLSERRRRGGLKTILAESTRQRLFDLSTVGVGRKAVHEFTGIDHRTLAKIKNGETRYVRKKTADLIEGVPANAFCDRAVIDAKETKRLLRRMLSPKVGFTRAEIGRRLGDKRKCPTLQIGTKRRVTARTAMRIERLYNIVTAGDELAA